QHPGRKTEAVSSVVADRLLGLYALAIVAAAALLNVEVVDPKVRAVLQGTLGFLLVGGVAGVIFIFWGGRFGKPDLNQLTESDTVGQRILTALLLFRSKLGRLFALLILSLFTHVFFALCVFMIACGLGGNHPSWGQHVVMVSIANVAGSIPVPGGLGAFEMALDFLYRRVADVQDSQGFVVALGFRLMTLGIALVGVVYYLSGRRELSRLMREAAGEAEKTAEAVD
ncbi:MAG: lysylphosphatidylglycerol synthase domain-containing protein, partial [Pirellulaceae bacterium]